jgi:hypothetical protein
MKWNLDRNLFTQSGLDSGALTMLGSVVHSFPLPGEYRGSVHKPGGEQAVFYLSVDKDSSVGSANIDLAKLQGFTEAPEKECGCECAENRFTVNPRGYVVFHVSGGSGGYSVHVRRASESREEKVFNSQQLGDGDVFAASIIRPGTYQVINPLTKAEASLVVAYPEAGKTAYRPPAPVRVQVGRGGFEPKRVELKPLQGLMFDIKAPARIVISLAKPDDGPGGRREPRPLGWSKSPLLAQAKQQEEPGQPDQA